MHPNFTLAIPAEEILNKCMCSVVKTKYIKSTKYQKIMSTKMTIRNI